MPDSFMTVASGREGSVERAGNAARAEDAKQIDNDECADTAARAELTRRIKDLARLNGAALVGIAPIERFDPIPPFYDKPPENEHPKFFVPDAKSVISIAMPILNPVLDATARMADMDLEFIAPDTKWEYLDIIYNRVGHELHDYRLEYIGQVLGQRLLEDGYDAMIFPTTGIHPRLPGQTTAEMWQNKGKYSKFGWTHGPFSHRHAATRAGLGEFGYNNIVLTREFGDRVRFNSIVTNAELEPSPLITEPICLRGKCGYVCIKACFMGAISRRDDPANAGDYRAVDFEIDDGQIFIDTPAMSNPGKCMDRRNKFPQSPVRGDCMRVCPVGKGRHRLHDRLQEMVKKEAGQPLREYKHNY